jgi:hypothetical protein
VATPLLDTIMQNDNQDYDDEEEIDVFTFTEEKKKTKKHSSAIKKYKRSNNEDDLRAVMQRLSKQLTLEAQLHSLEAQLTKQKLDELSQQLALKEEETRINEQEIALLREKEAFYLQREQTILMQQQQQQDPLFLVPSAVSVTKPKNKKNKKSSSPSSNKQKKQAPLENFMPIVDAALAALEQPVTVENPLALAAVVPPPQQQLAEQQALAEFEEQLYAALKIFSKGEAQGNVHNIGFPVNYKYSLRKLIDMILDATNQVTVRNKHLADLIDHEFLDNYRVSCYQNMEYLVPATEEERTMFENMQRGQVLDLKSPVVRRNISNLLVQLWFVSRAIDLKENSLEHGFIPMIISERAYSIAPEILHKWYPDFDAGIGTVLTEDLRIAACSSASNKGQGKNKQCCFCNQQFIGCINGSIKNAHQVTWCDTLANLSNDERVILQAVFDQKEKSPKFAKAKFICRYNENSFLRRATDHEIATNRYVTCPKTQEKLRVNIPVLLKMRERSYNEFINRIHHYDVGTRDKNLNARLVYGLVDCFGFSDPKEEYKCRMKDKDGLLFKTLVDFQGNNFMAAKVNCAEELRRNFHYDPETGFGDDLYFSSPLDHLQFLQEQQAAFDFAQQDQILYSPVQEEEEEQQVESPPRFVLPEPEPMPISMPQPEKEKKSKCFSGGRMIEYSLENNSSNVHFSTNSCHDFSEEGVVLGSAQSNEWHEMSFLQEPPDYDDNFLQRLSYY